MPKLLVFQHVAHEILGTLDPLLRKSGFRIRYVNFHRDPDARPNLEGYDGLVVLGGPMSVYDVANHPHLSVEIDAIRLALDRDLPILGVCLGAQLLSVALGGQVVPNPKREIGWYSIQPTHDGEDDPLVREFASTEQIFQWHGDTFSIPEGAVHLAKSPDCDHQAFRYGDCAYGFQFHLEVDEPMIERWLRIPVMRNELEGDPELVDAATVSEQTRRHIDEMSALGDRVFRNFLRLFGKRKRYETLPSR
jgi:GMP synthase (glutamine-hydrolysing)